MSLQRANNDHKITFLKLKLKLRQLNIKKHQQIELTKPLRRGTKGRDGTNCKLVRKFSVIHYNSSQVIIILRTEKTKSFIRAFKMNKYTDASVCKLRKILIHIII